VGATPRCWTATFALQQQGQIRKGFTRTGCTHGAQTNERPAVLAVVGEVLARAAIVSAVPERRGF
jgi:hypothetical protein